MANKSSGRRLIILMGLLVALGGAMVAIFAGSKKGPEQRIRVEDDARK